MLPGVYAPAGSEGLGLRAVALGLTHPDAVVVGRAAAALTWWPDLQAPVLTAAASTPIAAFPGYRFSRIRVPAALVMQRRGVRLSAPALTVLDLVDELGGAAIDEALRRGAVPDLRLGYEVDGHAHHRERHDFICDRTRDPELVEAGWVIVRFAAVSLTDRPAWVAGRIRAITAARALDLGYAGTTGEGRHRWGQ